MQIQPEEFLSGAIEPRSHLVERIGCDLIAGALRAGREVRLRVNGSSMLPAVLPGDTIVVRASTEPSSGEVVLFARYGRLFAHRVVGRSEHAGATRLTTRGDALADCDPPVMPSEILGQVVAIFRDGRSIPFRLAAPSQPMKLLSFALRHSDFLRRLILKIHAIRQSLRRTETLETRCRA